MSRRSVVQATALLLAALLPVAACSGEPPPVSLETVRVGVLTSADQLPFYVAEDEGFAAAHGLRVEETAYQGGADILAGLRADEIDVGSVSVPALALAWQEGAIPEEVVGIAAAGFASPDNPIIGVLAGKDVKDWADLGGRPVAVNLLVSLGAAGIAGRLAAEGARPADLIEVPFANMGLGVRNGDLAAAVTLEPYLTQSIQRGDGHLLGWVVGGPPLPNAQSGILSARAGFVREHPETAKAYLGAYLDAVAWIAGHDAEARSLLAKRLSVTPGVADEMTLSAFAQDGRNDPDQMAPLVEVFGVEGFPASKLPELYDEGLLEDVLQER